MSAGNASDKREVQYKKVLTQGFGHHLPIEIVGLNRMYTLPWRNNIHARKAV